MGLVLTGTKSHTGKGKGDFVVLHLAIYSVAVIVLSMMSNRRLSDERRGGGVFMRTDRVP